MYVRSQSSFSRCFIDAPGVFTIFIVFLCPLSYSVGMTDYGCFRSFCLSVDMAHAVHPNYKEKHQTENKPLLHKGIVIKENCNQRYASNAVSIAMLRTIATNAGVPVQNFVVRNDSPCGSTVGPTLSSSLGVRVIDIGVPQWAMHSIRETCGVTDIEHLRKLLENFFRSFRIIDDDFRSLE
eukprot:GHVU01117578.1.p1 GENE.GHVU01117578.1~~GHVU01117578.1.p1  ORF type:complete len:181 (+),score=7.47 GHVU01117578.1:211-753(+)